MNNLIIMKINNNKNNSSSNNNLVTRTLQITRSPADANVVSVVFATDTPVRRYYFADFYESDEVLKISNDAIDFSRLNNDASVCDTHNTYSLDSVLGVIVKNSAKINERNQCVCDIRLTQRQEVSGIINDIKNGIINNVSVGYKVLEYSVADENREIPTINVEKWQPYEISFVPVPADSNSKIQSRNMNKDNKKTDVEQPKKQETIEPQQERKQEQEMQIKQEIQKAVDVERKRSTEITKRCRAAKIPTEKEQEYLASNRNLGEISSEILDYYEAMNVQDIQRAKNISTGNAASSNDHFRSLENALCARADCEKLIAGNGFARYSLLDVAREIVSKGKNINGMATSELVRVALTTSDFPKLLMNVADKTLQKAYTEAPQTFRPLVREVSATDFKTMHRVKLGDAPDLEKVAEDGEFEHGAIGEEAESYKIDTYGKIIGLSRQAIINDDLDGFTRIPQLFGVAAARRESDLFWGLVIANPKMADRKSIFDAAHKNVNTTAAELNVDTFSKIRTAMRNQKTIDQKLMNLSATYLVVPSDYETVAEQFLSTNMLATAVADINVFQGKYQIISEPRLDVDNPSFYMFCNNSMIDTFEVAYLNGNRGVFLDQEETFSVDGIKFKARLDVGFGVIDHRGMYKQAVKK